MTETALDAGRLFETIGYEPHPKQWLFHKSPARFRIPCCGRRFGKSTMGARDMEPKLFLPKRRWWIVGPTYDLGEKEFRVLWDDLIVGQGLGKHKKVKKAYNKRSGEMFIEFPWQTRVEVRSADHPENLVGESLDGACMSEAAKHKRETFEKYIRPALADHRGEAIFPTTPEGYNWLYNMWQFGQDPDFPDYESWRFPSWDNPYVYPGGREDPEIKLIELTTTHEWFEQEIAADFSSFVGKIYSEFDETVHVQKVGFNPAWPNYMAIDWGFVNPLAAIEFQVTPDDQVRVWREHYMPYKRLGEHIQMWKTRENPKGYHLDMMWADAEDPEGIMEVNVQYGPCIGMPEAKKNWREGIDLVKSFLKLRETGEYLDEYGTPDQKPGLVIDRSCRNTIWEFNNYRSPEPKNDEPFNEAPGSKRPTTAKLQDHALDALRYGLMHVFRLGAQSHLADVWTPIVQEAVHAAAGEPSMTLTSWTEGAFSSGDTFFSSDQRF